MRLELGNKVQTSDGQEAGTLDRLILDPKRIAVKTVVLHTGIILGHSVEVPLTMLESGPEDTLRLTCTAKQADALPEFFAASYTTPQAEHSPMRGDAGAQLAGPLGSGVVGAPMTPGGETPDSATRREIEAAWQRQDVENAVIGAGSTVRDRDGETVGRVHGLVVDPLSGRLTRVVVRTGRLTGKDIELPAALIARVDDDVLDLATTNAST